MLQSDDFTKQITEKIIDWYEQHKRDLPWRNTTDPYLIWLSEVILQQTRVVQGLPYYEDFARKYPTVQALATAPDFEVLRLWQGLGYYSRARNMHATAQLIVSEHGGQFPTSYEGLLKLKGIGPYTAAAVASFSFGEVVPVVDGNVYRVLARLEGITQDIGSSTARKLFTEVATRYIDPRQPATFNQAIMEFGAMQCTPQKPNCMFCPVQAYCYAFQHQLQDVLPVKEKKTKVRERFFQYLVLEYREKYYLQRRGTGDVWEGLYDFYLAETPQVLTTPDAFLPEMITDAAGCVEHIGLADTAKHVLSHQRIYAQFWKVKWRDECPFPLPAEGLFSLTEIAALPKPILIHSFLEKHLF